MSKGSNRRPLAVSDQEYAERWDAIFGASRYPEHEREKNRLLRERLDLLPISDPQKIREAFEGYSNDQK